MTVIRALTRFLQKTSARMRAYEGSAGCATFRAIPCLRRTRKSIHRATGQHRLPRDRELGITASGGAAVGGWLPFGLHAGGIAANTASNSKALPLRCALLLESIVSVSFLAGFPEFPFPCCTCSD